MTIVFEPPYWVRDLREKTEALSLADALAETVRKALDGMDAAGGDRDGMPECPWCHSDGTWHDAGCGLVEARAALEAFEGSRGTRANTNSEGA